MTTTDNWYQVKDINKLDTPALLIYPDRVKKNIATAIEMVGDVKRLRPHIKTNKSPDAVKLLRAAGIDKFKCATIAEAEMLAMSGAKDVLMAYQPLGPKLERFVALIQKYPDTRFSCLTDNLIAATEQSEIFADHRVKVPVYIDLNLGMNRTGIAPGKEAVELYAYLSASPHMMAAGLHAYDGHLRDQDITERTRRCHEAFKDVEEFKATLESKELKVPNIIAGGSPTFPIHAKREAVECSPGTFIYWDKGYLDGCPEQDFLPAAVLVTRVISIPAAQMVCTDLGHKSVAAENEIIRRISFLGDYGLEPVSQSEEHLVATITGDQKFQVEDVLYGLPFHICPTVALYERSYTVENGKLKGEWMHTARDRKITV